MTTIGNSEADLEQALSDILPKILPQAAGYSLEIEIYENDRKKRRDASRSSWRPGSGEIRIKFGGAATTSQSQTTAESSQRISDLSAPETPNPFGDDSDSGRLADLIKSLDKAEQRPGFDFVALKWFRDQVLPAEGYGWAQMPSDRDEVLRNAIRVRAVLTSKVPNPKAPLFPVTSIRLNRQQPEVVSLLGEPIGSGFSFQAVSIRGEALSETVLRERR